MTELVRMRRRGATMTAIVALAAMLAACNPNPASQTDAATTDPNQAASLPPLPATLPLDSAPATAIAAAPAAQRLPAAAPIRTVRVAQPEDAWAYADDARDFTEVVYDAPPDYGFDYDGVEPWAWQGYDDSLVFAEPIDDGYRYYYYRPGAGRPYYVRDPDYGYGYDGDRLAAVYGRRGDILPYGSYGPRADYAGRYLSRGEALYRASRERQRRAVIAANWAARQQAIAQSQRRWAAEQASQRDWQTYHARTARRAAGYWQPERARRADDTRRYAEWRGRGFQAAPPPRVIPARWQQADWARDRSRYVAEARQAEAQRQQAMQRGRAEQLRQRQFADQRLQQQQQQQQQAAAQRAAQMQRAALVQRQQQAAEGQRARAMQQQQLRQRQAQVAQQQAQAAQRQAQAAQRATQVQRQAQLRQQQVQRQQAQRANQAQRLQQVRQQQAGRLQAQRAAQAQRQQAVAQQRAQQQRAAQVQAQARGRQQAAQRQAQLQSQRAGQLRAQQQQQARAARNAQADRARQMQAQRQVQVAQRQQQVAQRQQQAAQARQVQAAQRQAQVAQRQQQAAQARQAQAARVRPAPAPRPAGPPNRPGGPDRRDHR